MDYLRMLFAKDAIHRMFHALRLSLPQGLSIFFLQSLHRLFSVVIHDSPLLEVLNLAATSVKRAASGTPISQNPNVRKW
jgi:hypothetical protein